MPDTVPQLEEGTPVRPALSIVIPVYRGADSIGELVTALDTSGWTLCRRIALDLIDHRAEQRVAA